MDAFPALVQSLGEHAVAYIGKERLLALNVFGDPTDMSAEVEIYLRDNSWDEQTRAIDLMIELREMYLDELAISYRFAERDSETAEATAAAGPAFAMAG